MFLNKRSIALGLALVTLSGSASYGADGDALEPTRDLLE